MRYFSLLRRVHHTFALLLRSAGNNASRIVNVKYTYFMMLQGWQTVTPPAMRVRLIPGALLVAALLRTASPAFAACENSSDNLTRTCNGGITGKETFNHLTESTTTSYNFIFQGLTSQTMQSAKSQGPTLQFEASGEQLSGHNNGIDASALNLNVNTDAAISGFNIESFSSPSVQVQSTGSNGGSDGENKGGGKREGGDGKPGGSGGKIDLNLTELNISASPGKALTIASRGGSGGNGRENFSTGGGDGFGGNGGIGGTGSRIDLSLDNVTVSNLASGTAQVITASSISGTSGNGGAGKASDYTSRGGTGGTGQIGGAINFTISNGLNINAAKATGISLISHGGQGGGGGLGENELSNDGHGGDGSIGGNGGSLSFKSTDTSTLNLNASGDGALFMRSLAGAGGGGGEGKSSSGEGKGGPGGQGGTGGTVAISLPDNTLKITTNGEGAQGVFAHSWGGNGGDGGSGSSTFNKGDGGSAAGSGPGGNVNVTLNGDISTNGNQANAMLIHSVGGFSGAGGSGAGWSAYGGGSESSGPGGTVTINWADNPGASSMIQTKGSNSDAIFAQSQGGGGGKGGSGDGLKGVGGGGSSGGDGMAVIVNVSGSIINTTEEYSRGIVAQSVGGGGGDGGGSRSIAAIGGSGANGGSGSTVNVTNSAKITTGGLGSSGLFAQSIGGGGGSALSSSGVATIGGNGAKGGSGDTVTVVNSGDITTGADQAPALLAQSVGLGGGHGGSSHSFGVGFSKAVGGKGGTGGHGGNVVIQETAAAPMLMTTGDHSQGLMAQSVGGGGGHGGSALSFSASPNIDVGISLSGSGGGAGNGGTVAVDFNGGISTMGDHAVGLMGTSTGGAGGSAGTSLSLGGAAGTINIATGGSGGGGGEGEQVTVCRGQASGTSGNCVGTASIEALAITTEGEIAHGLLATSGGGGGGHSGVTIAGSAVSWESVNVSSGGGGGVGGSGEDVTVYSSGGITTSGNSSYGILAKSYGGTGGASFTSVAASTSTAGNVSLSVGGKGGAAGNAATASVTSTDTILTKGTNADGIAALSVAGSGGAGGVSISANTVSSSNIGIAIGGEGGGGATSGAASVDYRGSSIETRGMQSVGILAVSSAGSGGRGGLDVAGAVASLASVQVAVGGAGGNGGKAGTATVTNPAGSITTSGIQSPAISASSHGGAGGRGGASISSTAVAQSSAEITVGGGGGNGGTSNVVTVNNGGTLLTRRTKSQGIFAQSHGGSGGAGGFVAEGGINLGGEDGAPAGNVTVTVGGSGGTGGASSGVVNVFNSGNITTRDYKSDGILAQSVGGQGGAGGTVWSGEANAKAEIQVDVDVNVGGSGGAGGKSAAVEVSNAAVITTQQGQSHAIFAQSVGGNGGVGGSSYNILLNIQTTAESKNSAQVVVGGSGGKSAAGSTVMVSNQGSLITDGGSSAGIYAQSVGGNGGNGGSAGNILVNAGKAPAGKSTVQRSLEIDVGGAGGEAAESDVVTVINQGSITTNAQSSDGIFAQSVGGNGGDGGGASGYMLSVTGKCSFATGLAVYSCVQPNGNTTNVTRSLTVNVGGTGGGGGHGAQVNVHNTGAIATNAKEAHGIFAHSIGGGGGTGGSASDNLAGFTSSPIATAITDVIRASTANPYNLLKNYTSYQLSIGGKGGGAGNGKTVDIINSGTVATQGESAYGIHAQSIGGGGGEGGKASATFVYSLSVGGLGSGGGNGGTVTIDNSADAALVSTTGDNSIGIFAQSVGSGGGAGGDVGVMLGVNFAELKLGVGVGVKTADGKGGDGGDIDIYTGAVETRGKLAHGVFAHSVGGSGGALGYIDANNTPQGWAGNAKDDGAAGDVTINVDGQINVTGEQANGVFAQSAAGEDSKVSTNTGGKVTINVSGGVAATGTNARAILAQSEGGAKNGQVAITVASGATVTTAMQSETTIGILDGLNNTLTNSGTIVKPEGDMVTGYVIQTQGGALTINNSGTLGGSMKLATGSGNNAFNNQAGGTFEPGLSVNIGGSSTLTNAGVISPGGNAIVSSALTGKLTQTAAGQYDVNVVPVTTSGDPAQVDTLTVSGTAALAGTVKANILVTGSSASGDQVTPTILKATGGINSDTLTIVPSIAAQYSLTKPAANEIAIAYNIDWNNAAIRAATRDSHDPLAEHFDALFVAGAFDSEVATTLAAIETGAEYSDTVDTASPEIYANAQAATLYAALRFSDALLSCAVQGGEQKFVRQGQCGWFRFGARDFDQSDSREGIGFKTTNIGVAGGMQFALSNDWTLGWGAAYEDTSYSQDAAAQGEGDLYQLGVVAKKRFGATMLSGSLSGGVGSLEIERYPFVGGTSKGDTDLASVAAMLRGSYTWSGNSWFVTPLLDLGIDWIKVDGISETGGPLAFELSSQSDEYYHLRPAVEVGGEIRLKDDNWVLRPQLTLGVTQFLGDTKPSISGSLSAAPSSIDSFTVASQFDETYLDVAARFDMVSAENMALSVTVFGNVSDNTHSVGGEFKLAIPF